MVVQEDVSYHHFGIPAIMIHQGYSAAFLFGSLGTLAKLAKKRAICPLI